MLPSLVAEELRASLTSFLGTTFALADEDVRAELERFIADEEHGVFRGPFVRLRLPFRPAPRRLAGPAQLRAARLYPSSPPGGGMAASLVPAPPATADARHHRHRLWQDRELPRPAPRPLPAEQRTSAASRHSCSIR